MRMALNPNEKFTNDIFNVRSFVRIRERRSQIHTTIYIHDNTSLKMYDAIFCSTWKQSVSGVSNPGATSDSAIFLKFDNTEFEIGSLMNK